MQNLYHRIVRKARRTIAPLVAYVRKGDHVAIIGAGNISPTHIDAYQESGLVIVQSICDVSPGSLASKLDRYPHVQAFRDVQQMFNVVRPQIVSICTWPQTHADLVRLAVEYDVRGIMCEKPLALAMSEVNDMLRLCQEKDIKFAGGHQYRFHPYFVHAKAMVNSGQIGKIQRVVGYIKSSLANNGPHLFDTIRFLLNDREARSVACTCVRENDTYDRGTPVEEGATGNIEFADDIQVEFMTGTQSPEFFEISLHGSQGEIAVTPSLLRINGKQLTPGGKHAMRICRKQQFGRFIKWVQGKESVYAADGIQSAKSNELVLALYEAANLGTKMPMPLLNESPVLEALFSAPDLPPTPVAISPSFNEVVPKNGNLAVDGGQRCVKSWFGTKPHFGKNEWLGVGKVLASGNLNSVSGQVVKNFEIAVATAYGCPGAVASTSGTASIHVALGILGLEPGDEVITTPITDMGTIIPILWCNCVPVFCDIDPLTGNMTYESIEQKITPRTRAVVLVHLFGRGAEAMKIREMLDKKGIVLIEDCSQAHMAEVDNKLVGTIGDFGCFSLQQAKQITCGDGGFTLINRESDLHRGRLFVDKGWNRGSGTRAHEFLGMNYRMSELQGAVALAQFGKLPALIEARRRTANELCSRLEAIPGIVVPPKSATDSPSWWIYNFCIDEEVLGVSPDIFAQVLQVEGVQVRRNYLPKPIFEEEAIKNQVTYGVSGFPYSISSQPPPKANQMPGLQEFMARQIILTWSSRIQMKTVIQIAQAIEKVTQVNFLQPEPDEPTATPNVT